MITAHDRTGRVKGHRWFFYFFINNKTYYASYDESKFENQFASYKYSYVCNNIFLKELRKVLLNFFCKLLFNNVHKIVYIDITSHKNEYFCVLHEYIYTLPVVYTLHIYLRFMMAFYI